MDWNAERYRAFESERNRPAADLLAQTGPQPRARIVDLGCGPGNSTELLAQRYPGADILGLDTSDDMLAAARRRLPERRFERGDVTLWRGGPVDLIFANAVLQWVPDHIRLMARLMGELSPGGCLAVQMPDNADEPTHRLMYEVSRESPFREKLAEAGAARQEIGAFSDYAAALDPLSAGIAMWRTVYAHRLADHAAIVAMFESTGLRPYLAPLDSGERQLFLDRYRARVAEAYPLLAGGGVLLPFPRIFIVALRA
jgi:trans-aconitate 2-methyltransferase